MYRYSIIIVFLLVTMSVKAQFSVGVRQGLGLHGIYLWPSTMEKYQVPYQLSNTGLVIVYNGIKNSGLQMEINYATKGWQEKDSTVAGAVFKKTINYLEVPIYSHWEIGFGKFRGLIFAGPYLAWKLNVSTDSTNFSHIWNDNNIYNHYEKDIKNLDFGIKFGLGLKYNITNKFAIFIDARYDIEMAGGSDIFIGRPNDIQASRLKEIGGTFGILWHIIPQKKPKEEFIYTPKEDLYK